MSGETNRFLNPGFEYNGEWSLSQFATYETSNPFAGLRNLQLRTNIGFAVQNSQALQVVTLTPGETYPITALVNAKDAAVPQGNHYIQAVWYDGPILHVIGEYSWSQVQAMPPSGSDYKIVDFGDFIPTGSSHLVGFRSEGIFNFWVGSAFFYLDSVKLFGVDPNVAKSKLTEFLAALSSELGKIDDNIGVFHPMHRRLWTIEELEAAGLVEILQAGLFDDATRIGNKTIRLWLMQAEIETRPLTNDSVEYRNVVNLTGFYQWEHGDLQEVALRKATTEILDYLNTRSTELSDLVTGTGYCGFLRERPRMLDPVRPASLNNNMQGHSVTVQLTYFEEVSLSV